MARPWVIKNTEYNLRPERAAKKDVLREIIFMASLILSCPFRAYGLINNITPRLCLRAELIWAFSPQKGKK
jgi:hypothetical protein